jgi:CRP/FNR family transcriptional regulator
MGHMKEPRRVSAAIDPGPSLSAVRFIGSADGRTRLLTDHQREILRQIATRLELPARAVLYREGTSRRYIYICADGVVKSYRDLPSGKRRIATFLFSTDVFGLAENGSYVHTTQTLNPAVVYRFDVDELSELLRRDGELQFQFLCKVTCELREAQRHAILIGRRDAIGRLAMFLLMLRRNQPAAADRPTAIALPMSRSDIADFLGLSLEAVSRASSGLVRRGLIAFESRHLVQILDPAGLSKLAAKL